MFECECKFKSIFIRDKNINIQQMNIGYLSVPYPFPPLSKILPDILHSRLKKQGLLHLFCQPVLRKSRGQVTFFTFQSLAPPPSQVFSSQHNGQVQVFVLSSLDSKKLNFSIIQRDCVLHVINRWNLSHTFPFSWSTSL